MKNDHPPFVLALDDASARLSLVGGKGASLARMAAAGLPVPAGFHITTAAYHRFVAANELQRAILAAGEKLDDILASMHNVAEGVSATRAALQLAARYNVEMPIAEQLSLVLFEGLDPKKAVPELMMRDPKHELEGLFG